MSEGEIRAGEDVRDLKARVDQLARDLEAERTRGFWNKIFGRASAEPIEGIRERIRGRIAMALIVTLIIVVLATLGYLMWLSFSLVQGNPDDLTTVLPTLGTTIGTTLLTPLVGLIGAVTGFYYGGQQALQAASEASQAARQTQETSRTAFQEATQTGIQAATPAVPQDGAAAEEDDRAR